MLALWGAFAEGEAAEEVPAPPLAAEDAGPAGLAAWGGFAIAVPDEEVSAPPRPRDPSPGFRPQPRLPTLASRLPAPAPAAGLGQPRPLASQRP